MLNDVTATATPLPARTPQDLMALAGKKAAGDAGGPLPTSAWREPVIASECDECGRPLTASLLAWTPDIDSV